MKLKIAATLSLFLAVCFNGKSQIIIDNTPTPADLVTNTLIGPGLVTSNITFVGNAQQRAFFDGTGSNIGLADGVFLSSGNVGDVVPPNQPTTGTFGAPGDPDLLTVAQSVTSNPNAGGINATQDAAILEFDFVPNGDQVVFNFVFASEEYTTFINSVFNDAFGFFISGPGYAGPFASPAAFPNGAENLAVVPGTTDPITISTIYVDPTQTPPLPPSLNASYYIGTPVGHSFNGFTIPIEIRFDVICDSTYHFKFAVADCVDDFLDTGVFLEGGSFQAIPVDLSLETNVGNGQFGDSVIFEGCGTSADFVFTRPSCQSGDSLYVEVVIAGTATNGIDYGLIPDSVLFLPGSTEVIIPFDAFQDGIFEGYESVIVTVTNILPNGDTIVTTGTIWLLDNLQVEANAFDTTIVCMQDSLEVFVEGLNGVPPYEFVWHAIGDTLPDTSMFVTGTPNGSYDYYVTVIDACGFEDVDTLTVIVAQTLFVDAVISGPASSCLSDGWASADVSGQTEVIGLPFYNWSGPGQGGTISFDGTTTLQILPTGWYYFTVQDDVCFAEDSVFVDVIAPPIADFTMNVSAGCSPLVVEFTNTSLNSVTFEWDFGNGNVQNVTGMGSQTETFLTDAIVTLTSYDASGCPSDTQQSISVEPCGCTDPTATNYNPTATIDNGTCVYPVPSVEAPNIMTPNGDDLNDIFEMIITNAVNVDLVIINRWGNVVHESNGLNPTWNGKTPNGTLVGEGTYFYKYSATGPGINPEPVVGHGFVQVVIEK
jgi:gliding motility-associated-like protein